MGKDLGEGGEKVHAAETVGGVPTGMEKEQITKDDGRYLIYYRFHKEDDSKKHACQSGCCCGTSSGKEEARTDAGKTGKGCGTCQN